MASAAAPAVSAPTATAIPAAVTRTAAPAPQPQPQPKRARDTRPRVLVVVAPVAFHEGELETVRSVLAQSRARLILASTQPGAARGIAGHAVPVETTVDAVRPDQIEMLVIIGGPGAKTYLWFNPALKSLVQKLNRRRAPLGALSISVGALVNAGVLDGRQATSLPAPELQKLFARHQVADSGREVAVDGNVVTGCNTFAAADFAVALSRMLPRTARRPPAGKRPQGKPGTGAKPNTK